MPLSSGKVQVWDATCPDTYAPSHVSKAAREVGAVALKAEQRKRSKYTLLESSHHFVPFALETSGVLGQAALDFIGELGQRLRQTTREPCTREYLLQRLSIAVQRRNAAAVLGTTRTDPPAKVIPSGNNYLLHVHVCMYF